MQTIKQTIDNLHGALKDYIEATYHISSASLISQREALLNRDGVIHRIPYLESTPRYKTGESFDAMDGLPDAALEIFTRLSVQEGNLPKRVYDPPYKHQGESLKGSLINGKNLVIMTGTGSGKTESFLFPILGKLAREAKAHPTSFAKETAMRALVLYPMNALVNDQLGRLRGLFGDPRLMDSFKTWCGRPPRFARYTSRTPYAGIRTKDKDSRKLQAFDDFYVDILRRAESADSEESAEAKALLKALKERGKWPAKPDLSAWFGQKGTEWQNRSTGDFVRAVTRLDDSELLTRHEVQIAPPDLLVTNYSMLEYMLMRPIERPIFDKTREWLRKNPNETFLVVLDEAHLYRGAAGAEVGLLLRRLRDRLGISEKRLQIICATASFSDPAYAPEFGAQLTGVPADTFIPVQGTLDLRKNDDSGSLADAEALAAIDLQEFYEEGSEEARVRAVSSLLEYRGILETDSMEQALFEALQYFGPMGRLINITMEEAKPIAELSSFLFNDNVSPQLADEALTVLLALGSVARQAPGLPGLLPCRVHNFFRGLPGLWVCMDPSCSEISEDNRGGICGKMYSQPISHCNCGARVLELFTCRNCGTAYARAYTDDVDEPQDLWAEPGKPMRMADGESAPLEPLDLLLEVPANEDKAEPAIYDLQTGQLNSHNTGPRIRTVYVRQDRLTYINEDDEEEGNLGHESPGKFVPCAVCGKAARFGRSYVQDHQTKGDQPFQALLTRQIQIQPPGPQNATRFAPLRGRKVLAFSDSRQVAARLAPNVQMFSERDSLRPLIIAGFKWLQDQESVRSFLNLDDLFLGVLLASKQLNVRLRPKLHDYESFEAEEIVEKAFFKEDHKNPTKLLQLLLKLRAKKPPAALLSSMLKTLSDRFYGMETLALASLKELDSSWETITALPPILGIAETDEAKISLSRFWLRCWTGFGLTHSPGVWIDVSTPEGYKVQSRNPRAKIAAINDVIRDKEAKKLFWNHWHPALLEEFTASKEGGNRYLNGSVLTLQFDGEWVHCARCKSVHRPIPGLGQCLDCGGVEVNSLDPDADKVFQARKGFYRKPVTEALASPPRQPMALIAAEHTAQLNAPQNEDIFSKAEENELLFQDIALISAGEGARSAAIDILSSTTTMEVGIDLGALSGVALRNMPPGRANYQQRAGRAGRRGNAVATVIAFGSADSHDEQYFSRPDEMIRGAVVDPKLTLDNREIARRHIRAFLLQNYHQDRLPKVDENQPHDLFSVLGSVDDFRNSGSILNRDDFAVWLAENESRLRERIAAWLPSDLSDTNTRTLLNDFVADCLHAIDDAITSEDSTKEEIEIDGGLEEAPEMGEERPQQSSQPNKLLDRLLYRGKLPRYAFPTDVATFHVFDRDRSNQYRHVMRFAPSQGLPVALSQYAPGKQVWISGKCYTSGAIYSPMKGECHEAWKSRRLYMECSECGYAKTFEQGEVARGDTEDCRACGESDSFGPAQYWLRPPGFAHPIFEEEVTSPDEIPETSYATRAKLTMDTPDEADGWLKANDYIRSLSVRKHLLVSNSGPQDEGYTYCVKCGCIEASSTSTPSLFGPHRMPFPEADDKQVCEGMSPTRHLVLGTDFITDIALFSMRVEKPIELKPAHSSTHIALRTVSEALAKAAGQLLEIEPGELMAEFRPAPTPAGKSGKEIEIFLYDTLPGGAGFATQIASRGSELFQRALDLLKNCPEDCDASCYRCLRRFQNKLEHRLLDRHVGVELLEYLLTGQHHGFNPQRIASSTELLLNDLQRRCDNSVNFIAGAKVSYGKGKSINVPILAESGSRKFVIALSGPLSSGHPSDPNVADLRENSSEYFVITPPNELEVRGNLPAVSRKILQQLQG